ncbi:hypothetical protein OG21DRAFT_1497382 [Imleria badia]|nr:hypothetical protein OG21DRAFT_1497382 [Imleria badia]
MSFCIICFLRRFHRFQQINVGQQHLPSLLLDPSTELEDSRKFSLNSLTALLAVLAVSGSKALHPVALTLLIYTISLRLAINTCFFHNYPTLSRFLHVIPLLGMSCMAGVELVSGLQSPALATVGILLGVLPLVTLAVHHGRQCTETPTAGLPVQMQRLHAPAVSGSVDTTIASS